MTDNEIIKALECFAIDKDFDESQCIGCVFEHEFCTANMSYDVAKLTLDLINRQKAEIELWKEEASSVGCANEWLKAYLKDKNAEIEKLQADYSSMQSTLAKMSMGVEQAKAEAIKEVIEGLKSKKTTAISCDLFEEVVRLSDIESIINEKVADANIATTTEKE